MSEKLQRWLTGIACIGPSGTNGCHRSAVEFAN